MTTFALLLGVVLLLGLVLQARGLGMTAVPPPTSLPAIATAPRRFVTQSGDLLEAIEHPLYSSVGLDNAAIPQELTFFGYGVGDNVPGAGNAAGVAATKYHTNLDRGGSLARPKVFSATGIRFHLPLLAFTGASNTPSLSDPSFGAAAADNDLFEDLLAIFYSGHVSLEVGEKTYIDEPLFLMPSMVGFGGMASLAVGANAGAPFQDVTLPHTFGIERSFMPYPILISSQQSFTLRLRFPWATNITLNDDRLLVAILDGKLGREVQ